MSVPLIGIDKVIETYGANLQTGAQLDSFLVAQMPNFLDVPRRFRTAFELATSNPYLWLRFAGGAASVHDLPEELLLAAEYPPQDCWPFFRLYCYRYGPHPGLSREALLTQLSIRVSSATAHALTLRYSDPDHVTRARGWVSETMRALAPSTMMAEGRIQNTAVKKTYILHRAEGTCVICGSKASGYVASTVYQHAGVLYIAQTCSPHQALARESPTLLHFIFSLLQMNLDLGTVVKSACVPEHIIEPMCEILASELDAPASRTTRKDDQTTITFVRPSGFRVILRLRTLLNYAYMILDPNGKQLRRIDSAPDHPELPFFPDHLHLAPGRDNSNVTSSFTYGLPLLDLPLIQRLLSELEPAAPGRSCG